MSELPDLPPPPRRSRPVPDGGLDAVVAAGRARRSRATATGATTALALVLAGVLVQPTDALRSLNAAFRPAPAATSSPTEAPQVDPSAPPIAPPSSPEPTLSPSAAAQQQPTPSSAPEADERGAVDGPEPTPSPVRPSPSTSPSAAPAPTSTASAAPSAPVLAARPAYREDTDEQALGTASCAPATDGSGGTGDDSPCSYETSSGRTAGRGQQVTASYGQCSRGEVTTVFAFAGGQEKEVVVTGPDGQEVFRFSATVRYAQGAHERRLRPGTCIEWTGRWDLVTSDGQPVPAGSYRMTTTVSADRVHPEGAADPKTRDFRATTAVTVRVVG